MKKITVEVPEEVHEAIEEEGQREFRNVSQQASYLLLTWSRVQQATRQRMEKVVAPTASSRREETLNGASA